MEGRLGSGRQRRRRSAAALARAQRPGAGPAGPHRPLIALPAAARSPAATILAPSSRLSNPPPSSPPAAAGSPRLSPQQAAGHPWQPPHGRPTPETLNERVGALVEGVQRVPESWKTPSGLLRQERRAG